VAGHVYREFTPDDLFSTKVHAQPSIIVESGSLGWSGNLNAGNGASLSLYGDVRRRSDVGSGSQPLQVYPLDLVDTNSVDRVIGVPGTYPQTGSVNLAYCTNTEHPAGGAATDTRWYDAHWSAINNLSDWSHYHINHVYPALDELPDTLTVVHVPEMFYGRQIATGSVLIWTHAWDSASGSNFGSGTRYYVDDGLGRLFDVPSGSYWKDAWMSGSAVRVGTVFYENGLIVFTSPSASWHNEFFSASYNTQEASEPNLHVQFSGSTIIQSMVFMCRMGAADVNCSNNPSFLEQSGSHVNGTPKLWSRMPDPRTYITAVGLYNEERQLVAVAKIAQPIRKREQDVIDIRLRMDV
jgi:hypothetical protein